MIKDLDFVAFEGGLQATTALCAYTITPSGCGMSWRTLNGQGSASTASITEAKEQANTHWRRTLYELMEPNPEFLKWCKEGDIYSPNDIADDMKKWAKAAQDGRI